MYDLLIFLDDVFVVYCVSKGYWLLYETGLILLKDVVIGTGDGTMQSI